MTSSGCSIDINGDILWRDTSGNGAIWFINAGQVLSAAGINAVPISWTIADINDFNGDGKSDILWRGTSGNTIIGFMKGAQVCSTADLGVVSATWMI